MATRVREYILNEDDSINAVNWAKLQDALRGKTCKCTTSRKKVCGRQLGVFPSTGRCGCIYHESYDEVANALNSLNAVEDPETTKTPPKTLKTQTPEAPQPEMQRVNRHTRAGRDGKAIVCGYCNHVSVVYHFAWCALVCLGCERNVQKHEHFIPVKRQVDVARLFRESDLVPQ